MMPPRLPRGATTHVLEQVGPIRVPGMSPVHQGASRKKEPHRGFRLADAADGQSFTSVSSPTPQFRLFEMLFPDGTFVNHPGHTEHHVEQDTYSPAFSPICASPLEALSICGGPLNRLPVITARSTASPSEMCRFFWRNSQPRTTTLPDVAWIAARSPSLPHCTKVQSLKPTVPRPEIFAIWLHGPQNALLLKRTTPLCSARTSTMVGSSP